MEKLHRTGAELFVQCLMQEGVQYVFGVPGEENLAFVEALRTSPIQLVVTRHEQAAVFMAATVGRLTGKVGVALSTLGPGATNLLTGMAYAQLGGMPVLAITGQKPIRRSKQGKFQILDVVEMMRPVTKYSATVIAAERIPSMVRQAIKTAEAERPGAVHIELPEDIAAESTDERPIAPVRVRRPAPDAKAVAEAARAIAHSANPIIVIASGANRRLVRKQLRVFLEKTGIPFVTTQMGKGVEDESSPLYIGTTALSAGDYVHHALRKADLVVMLGHDISEKPPIVLTPDYCKVVHVNFTPADIDAVYEPTHEVVGDISTALWMLSETVTPSPAWDFSYAYKVKAALEKNVAECADAPDMPLRPERIVADIARAAHKDAILALDNGMYKIWIARNYKAHEQNSVLLDNALASMGAGLPSGIAAKLINPDRQVLTVTGDGGLLMCLGDLETAVRLGVHLVVLVLNDSGYGMIKWKQQDMGLPAFGLDFTNPDFVRLAESFGATGHRVASAGDLVPILQQAFAGSGVHLIDCPTSYAETHAMLQPVPESAISSQ